MLQLEETKRSLLIIPSPVSWEFELKDSMKRWMSSLAFVGAGTLGILLFQNCGPFGGRPFATSDALSLASVDANASAVVNVDDGAPSASDANSGSNSNSNSNGDDAVDVCASGACALPNSGTGTLGVPWVFYDPANDRSCGEAAFVDAQILPLSFANAAGGADVQFAVQDFKGRNYWVKGQVNGAGFQNLKRQCEPIFTSGLNSTASARNGAGWMIGFFKGVGSTVHSVIHDEFYGGAFPQKADTFPNAGCNSGNSGACWYSVINAAISTDRGGHFELNGKNGAQTIVRPSFSPRGAEYGAATGYFVNTNVIKKNDRYYLLTVEAIPKQVAGTYSNENFCLLETTDLSRPDLWRAWDGKAFTIRSQSGTDCKSLSIPISPFYVGYNSYFKSYVAVGSMRSDLGSKKMNFAYSLSNDLVTWTAPVDLGFAPDWSTNRGDSVWGNYNYLTISDPSELVKTNDDSASSGIVSGRDPLLLFIDLKRNGPGMLPDSRVMARAINFSNRNDPVPVIDETGLGCADKTCVWAKGRNFSTKCKVTIRLVS